MKARPGPSAGIPRVPGLDDLPGPTPSSRGRALVRATLDLPLSADPRRPLAHHRARLLADTVTWLRQHGFSVTITGDVEAGGPGDREGRLDDVRRTMGSILGSDGSQFELIACDEDARSVEKLVDGHDVFVNDTLQDSLLPLPSLLIPPQRLPSAVGRTLEHDLGVVARLLEAPPRPLVAVLGGERSWLRLHGLRGLVLRADTVLMGGALAPPMIRAIGHLRPEAPSEGAPEGAPDDSQDEFLRECRHVYGLSRRVHHRIVLPLDVVLADPAGAVVPAETVPAGSGVSDIGPVTRVRFRETLDGAGSILWTGALGQVESAPSQEGTRAVGERLSHRPGRLVVLGGDALVRFLADQDLLPAAAHLLSSTDGAVELLKNGDLPALAALRPPPGTPGPDPPPGRGAKRR